MLQCTSPEQLLKFFQMKKLIGRRIVSVVMHFVDKIKKKARHLLRELYSYSYRTVI
jgi:hypothetical protein